MKNAKLKVDGFTLIELLVVIAIIGLLSSIVLASLSTSRLKAKDAAIQEAMSGMRAEAELSVVDGTYPPDICGIGPGGPVPTAGPLFKFHQALLDNGATNERCRCPSSGGYCDATAPTPVKPSAWAYTAVLNSGQTFCVDSTGKAKYGLANTAGAYCN